MRTSSGTPCSAIIALSWVAGCSGGGSPSAGPDPSSTTSGAASATAAATATSVVEAPLPAAIPEADVKKLIAVWLDAQNSGDLNAYLALYADRFEGVRRSGERMARMDRKGWVAARTKLFAKKMVVAIEDLVVSTSPTTAQVNFMQTWASGTYKDVGPKLIVVVKGKNGLRIAREEMLRSTLQGVKPLAPLAPEQFSFVIHEGGPRVVLKTPAPASWAEGAPELLADKEPYPTKVAVSASKLPADLAAWAGKKMRLYGPSGPVCEATLGSLSLVGRVIPHFGEVARWNGQGELATKPLSKAQKARAAWELAAGASPNGVVLTADLTSVQGDCKPALWAQPAAAAESKVARAEPADAALAKSLLEAFRKLPDHAEIQKTSETKGPWDERGKPEIVTMRHPSGKQVAFISVSVMEGCGDFEGRLSAAFEVGAAGLQLAGKPMSALGAPAGAIDADGDGKLEILFKEQLLRGEVGFDRLEGLTIPFLDCGC
jgi:ketosteroid isomerase-like protein